MRKEYLTARELPIEWDSLVKTNLYLKREFLEFLEKTEKAGQKYHAFFTDDGAIDSILVEFKRDNYNLFMFTKKKIAIKITMFYFPLSVSRPAFVVGSKTKIEVLNYIKSVKGYKIMLNAEEDLIFDGFARGKTCPRCVLTLQWNTFKDYLNALRSSYRYRYNKALKKSDGLIFETLKDNKDFSEKLYSLYESVFNNSKTKLEKLSIDFFRDSRFKILVIKSSLNEELGFVQLLGNGDELIFEFVGFDHEKNEKYDLYIRLLLEIVNEGILGGYKTIDFGQTADDAKLKLGSKYTYLYALLHHSNRLINFVCKRLAKKIEYRPEDENKFHIFKEKNENIISKT